MPTRSPKFGRSPPRRLHPTNFWSNTHKVFQDNQVCNHAWNIFTRSIRISCGSCVFQYVPHRRVVIPFVSLPPTWPSLLFLIVRTRTSALSTEDRHADFASLVDTLLLNDDLCDNDAVIVVDLRGVCSHKSRVSSGVNLHKASGIRPPHPPSLFSPCKGHFLCSLSPANPILAP